MIGATASPRRRVHWNETKLWLLRAAERVAASLPDAAGALLLRAAELVALALYFVPGVPLRGACRDLTRLAARRGVALAPFAIYRRLIAELRDVTALYHRLYRSGRDAVLPHVQLREEDRRVLASLFEQDGAFVIAVAHNTGAVLYAARFAAQFPCLLVAKRSKRPEVDALLLRFFERLGVPIALPSRRERVAFTRRRLAAVEERRAIIAPFDRIDRRAEGLTARIFGSEVWFPVWALRVAVRRKLPILPAWVRVEQGELFLELGAPIREADPGRALQDAIRQLEQWILRDPGSWPFLIDKRWRQVLRGAEG